ncbi:UDP-N-acetylbacillosamine N-acetyltransferase [Formosa sp. Hel1_31_208]|uniref:acetyltransferase n=1 Tax=Formosa sp. Hel1_31_208 TaxID=1798225 RepID=UPI00087AB5FD|nr:acetyltransferase [Formosa sp. Hel1_31_208]SDR91521.1 UDP-N-acetylbacillosamine N-acetyltransferase [Formosa sp. Hel1_31_208]
MSDKKIVLIGYSGHGLVVAETAKTSAMNLQFYTEKEAMHINPFQLDYLGFEGDHTFSSWDEPFDYILGIGDNHIRAKVANLIRHKGKNLLSVIHSSAHISEHVSIGQGTFIAKQSVVNVLARIGDHCILNTGCIVEHECKIANGVHVAPGAILLGNVTVGEQTFIGANTVVKENITIGKHVIIGAGSVVLRDIPDHSKVAGNPARTI